MPSVAPCSRMAARRIRSAGGGGSAMSSSGGHDPLPPSYMTVAAGCGGVRVVGGAAAGQDFLIETVERLGEVTDDCQSGNGVGGYRLVGQQQGHRGGGGDDRAGPRGAGWWVGGERVDEDGAGRGGGAWADEAGSDGGPVVRPSHHGVGRVMEGAIGWCGPFARGRTASSASGDGERPAGNARAVMSCGDLSTLSGGDVAGSGGGCSAVPTVPVCGSDAAALDAAGRCGRRCGRARSALAPSGDPADAGAEGGRPEGDVNQRPRRSTVTSGAGRCAVWWWERRRGIRCGCGGVGRRVAGGGADGFRPARPGRGTVVGPGRLSVGGSRSRHPGRISRGSVS